MKRRARRLKRGAVLLGLGAAACAVSWLALDAVFPLQEVRLVEAQAGGSPFILDRDGGLIAWRVDASDAWRLPVDAAQVSPWLVRATVAAEDKRFWEHAGIDPLALARAVRQNVTTFRRVSGASTITMQTIRLLHPRPRTYPTKCIETFRALQFERAASKADIIGLYLNLAPYGGNVVGAEAAARRYFGKPAADLSLAEAALLAGLPQRPARFNPRTHLDRALRRREFVLGRMRELGLASDGELEAARRQPLTICPAPCRTDAPRFADYVLALRRGEGGVIRTTLAPGIQRAARGAVREHARELDAMGIDGTAAVVIGVERSELLAMVGTGDPGDPRTGWINGATVRRQPGSLLKPFIYAAAFDAGILTPRSVVYDVPTSWRGYAPRNMDRGFLGAIPAAEALSRSRNVPAVRVLGRLGPSRLAADLNRMGLGLAAADERCGLSLALGTAEVRLVDIANAYAALARLGRYRPLRVLAEEERFESRSVWSCGAAYLTLRSLRPTDRGRPLRLVWKTGTSWNHRDAWAVAVTRRHVVGVWCGRHSGREHPALVGAEAALPLALEIADRILPGEKRCWTRPAGVAVRRVCALSGGLPTGGCPHTVSEEYLPGVSSEAPCAIHRLAARDGSRRVVTVWPRDVADSLASRKRAEPAGRPSIEIVSPADGAEYVLPASNRTADRVLDLTARCGPDGATIFWFLDGELLAQSSCGESARWRMTPGRHELIACAANGASRRIQFSVVSATAAGAALTPSVSGNRPGRPRPVQLPSATPGPEEDGPPTAGRARR